MESCEDGRQKILSVSELNSAMQKSIRASAFLNRLTVCGEISNFKRYSSGHWYFSLKDENAQVSCVMFKGLNSGLDFLPGDGMAVVVKASADFYVKNGQFQLKVNDIQKSGYGLLFERLQKLKEKLKAEGIFDREKRSLPMLPRKIGVVTSPSGAVIRDICRVSQRRFPNIQILLSPSSVQGEGAAAELVSAFKLLDARKDIDVIIIGRGGGSFEDLWEFNDENLVRTLASAAHPVISAVGHETDFTLCDAAADLRCATPSAAAEAAVPVKAELIRRIDLILRRLELLYGENFRRKEQSLSALINSHFMRNPEKILSEKLHRLDRLSASRFLSEPLFLLSDRIQRIDELSYRLESNFDASAKRADAQLSQLKLRFKSSADNFPGIYKERLLRKLAALKALSPLKVLGRGYAFLSDADGKTIFTSASSLKENENIRLTMHDGSADAEIKKIYMEGLKNG